MSRFFFVIFFVLNACLCSGGISNIGDPSASFLNNSFPSSVNSLIDDIKESDSIIDNKIDSSDPSINTESNATILFSSSDSLFVELNPNETNDLSEEEKNSNLLEEHQEINTVEEVPIVLIIPSYNNAAWYSSNLDSALNQKYNNYRIIYINDCSTDNTFQFIEEKIKTLGLDYRAISFNCSCIDEDIPTTTKRFIDLVNEESHFFTLINNSKRSGALANLYRAINSCQDNEIIGILDGDDWLSHLEVLQQINAIYSKKNIWLTHGRFLEYPHGGSSWSMYVPEEIIQFNAFRHYRLPSHFRTFYTWLFKKIQLNDLLYEGNFYPMTGDMAMMFPMIEMAAERHAYIDNINYVYNMANQLNDNKQNALLQRDLDAHIRGLPFYHRIENENLPSLQPLENN